MSDIVERIPFKIVISDEKLMGKLWQTLSLPQRTILKAFYGLPLKEKAEQALWAVFNGNCEYDELGYITAIIPTAYHPKEYAKLVGLLGRRSGKSTHITAFAVLYEIIFGGHHGMVKKGETLVVPYVATDLDTAKENMMAIKRMAEEYFPSKLLESPQDEIRFANNFVVKAMSTSVKLGRGWAVPIVVMDEVGFWYTKTDAAAPDYEVENAVSGSMGQFEPFAKMFIISTPYIEDGILWDYHNAGTDGHKVGVEDRDEYKNALVVWAPTAAMGNPMMTELKGKPTRVKLERKRDGLGIETYTREYLAKFVKAIGGYIEAGLIDRAISRGVKERKRKEVESGGLVPYYVASMDPATRHDSWAFTIGHRDHVGRVVQDVLRVWEPPKGSYLNPDEILDEITLLCREWGVNVIYTDQHQFESLQQLALQKGITLIRENFSLQSKKNIYGSLLHLLRNSSIQLLDVPVIRLQLSQLQKKYTARNEVQIGAPPGKHDDVGTVLAIFAKIALTLFPSQKVEKKKETMFEAAIRRVKERQREMQLEGEWV